MSLQAINKDHLSAHAGVSLVAGYAIAPPESEDVLVFWTRHPTRPREVDLNEFSSGKSAKNGNGGAGFVPFIGRPSLIHQLLPAIRESLAYSSTKTVDQFYIAIRNWWRVLDQVELAARRVGEEGLPVLDVRSLTVIHAEFAKRAGMLRTKFNIFRSIVDVTLLALRERATYWESPEYVPPEHHLPPQNQRDAFRIAVKRESRRVLAHWENCDELRNLTVPPDTPDQAQLWMCVRHVSSIQLQTGSPVPSSEELNGGSTYKQWTHEHLGVGLRVLRATAFPDGRDAQAIWTQCLINTPWNPSTLLTLDVRQRFLFDHFKDDPTDPHRRWVLVGQKERSGGSDQFVFGMWKTKDGPGHLIKTYLSRVEPLRAVLEQELEKAKASYAELQLNTNERKEASKIFSRIAALEEGCRRVWLFVNQKGKVDWLQEHHSHSSGYVDGRTVPYLEEVRARLNSQRKVEGADIIPKVTTSDFRVWYADYVYRASHGSILAVKTALGHSQVVTSIGYVNNKMLNQEASNSARKFLEILLDELDRGRVDLTILSHLFRHGELTAAQQVLLSEMRSLPKSREGVGCRDAWNPPAHLKATPGRVCDKQRCLLCAENAVLLPESFDGIAMREAELITMQATMPATTWVEEKYDVELENQKLALRRYELNQVMQARRKWSSAIASGDHVVPGVPLSTAR